jgi:hypothetical protein
MLWAVLTIVIGGLQALDSGVLQAGRAAQVLVALGVAAPALALATVEKGTVWIGALIAAAIVLVWARVVSDVPLNALHIGLFVPAMYVFFVSRLERKIAG